MEFQVGEEKVEGDEVDNGNLSANIGSLLMSMSEIKGPAELKPLSLTSLFNHEDFKGFLTNLSLAVLANFSLKDPIFTLSEPVAAKKEGSNCEVCSKSVSNSSQKNW